MKTKHFIFIAALLLLVTSCYKLINVTAPKEVEAGTTFEVRMAIADDGSATQNFREDWSYAGIRVPEGWQVTMPKGAHEQYAESWVYYENGQQVAARQDMVADDYLTEIYETAAPKSSYKWQGFSSSKMVGKHMTACWRNGCDSIVISFLVTVPADAKPGKYTLDFIAGDEEDAMGVYKYNDYAATKDSRLFHAGTISTLAGNRKVENANTQLSQTITVTEASAVESIKEAGPSDNNIYDVQGRLVRRGTDLQGLPHGTYVVNGKKYLK